MACSNATDDSETDDGGSGLGGACAELAKLPAKVETLRDFTDSEDFVFDELGNYVAFSEGNLVRIDKDGRRELWASGFDETAGMAMLPDGSLVVADVTAGALRRVYPNGASEIVLGGLRYPNGVDIGPDVHVYVVEIGIGGVRRVNPETGEFTVVALGLYGPNGVAFGNDPGVMYVSSFGGGGVYKVELPSSGALGRTTILARLPGATLPEARLDCSQRQLGGACDSEGVQGKCEQLGNVIACIVTEQLAPGTSSSHPCADMKQGERCHADFDVFGAFPGVCEGSADGALACVNPCAAANDGKECQLGSRIGECFQESCLLACAADTVDEGCRLGEEKGECARTPDGAECKAKQTAAVGSGVDGIGVDACGNVYADEFGAGIVWRISPKGKVERVAQLPSSWIPNVKWGRGLGGFEKDVMFVADRNQGRLFAIQVGIAGATEYYDVAARP
jgi:sugar lactone lactonase YvrE